MTENACHLHTHSTEELPPFSSSFFFFLEAILVGEQERIKKKITLIGVRVREVVRGDGGTS